jgi:hypothetical protein
MFLSNRIVTPTLMGSLPETSANTIHTATQGPIHTVTQGQVQGGKKEHYDGRRVACDMQRRRRADGASSKPTVASSETSAHFHHTIRVPFQKTEVLTDPALTKLQNSHKNISPTAA